MPWGKPGVIRFNIIGVEISREDEIAGVVLNKGEPLVDSPHGGIVHYKEGVCAGAVPAGDGPVFGNKNEAAGDTIDVESENDAVDEVGDDSRGSGRIGAARGGGYTERSHRHAAAIVDHRVPALVVGDPERLTRHKSDGPRIVQIRICVSSNSRGIRDQVGLLETVGLGVRRIDGKRDGANNPKYKNREISA